jgi:hypothetical protein
LLDHLHKLLILICHGQQPIEPRRTQFRAATNLP